MNTHSITLFVNRSHPLNLTKEIPTQSNLGLTRIYESKDGRTWQIFAWVLSSSDFKVENNELVGVSSEAKRFLKSFNKKVSYLNPTSFTLKP